MEFQDIVRRSTDLVDQFAYCVFISRSNIENERKRKTEAVLFYGIVLTFSETLSLLFCVLLSEFIPSKKKKKTARCIKHLSFT